MYGLLSSAYSNYRITNDPASREKFRQAPKAWLKHYVSWPTRGALMLVEILLTVLALLALYDTYMVKQWPAWLLVAVLILFFLPLLGDVTALFIIIYWAVEVGGKSELLAKLRT
jgi:hypothetical protein